MSFDQFWLFAPVIVSIWKYHSIDLFGIESAEFAPFWINHSERLASSGSGFF